jgi:hypothetical protein
MLCHCQDFSSSEFLDPGANWNKPLQISRVDSILSSVVFCCSWNKDENVHLTITILFSLPPFPLYAPASWTLSLFLLPSKYSSNRTSEAEDCSEQSPPTSSCTQLISTHDLNLRLNTTCLRKLSLMP